jgi:hypothetical protein
MSKVYNRLTIYTFSGLAIGLTNVYVNNALVSNRVRTYIYKCHVTYLFIIVTLRLYSDGARVHFVVWVQVCGIDDLLIDEISGVRTGDICENAERVDARSMIISPSVMRMVGDVGVCVSVYV